MELTKEERVLTVKILLESYITEREGMLAENLHRQQCGNSIAYGDEAFSELAEKIKALKDILQ